jgi:hypothetical protein
VGTGDGGLPPYFVKTIPQERGKFPDPLQAIASLGGKGRFSRTSLVMPRPPRPSKTAPQARHAVIGGLGSGLPPATIPLETVPRPSGKPP